MNDTIPTLAQYRAERYRQRLERCEKALIEERAKAEYYQVEAGAVASVQGRRAAEYWDRIHPKERQHYRALAENELVREGLVRPSKERQMEAPGNGQTGH